MANLGRAFITVSAVTSGFANDIRKGFQGSQKDVAAAGDRSGRRFGSSFSRAFTAGGGGRQLFGPAFFKEADQAQEKFSRLLRIGYVLGPLLTAIGGILGALGASLFVVGAAASVASQALIVLPASLVALAQAAIVAKVAMIGVGEAIKLGLKPVKGAGEDTKTLQNALERLEDAKRRLARAEEARAEAIESANRRVVDAEENYIDSQVDSEKAAQSLAQARREATEDLKQLRFETEGAAISEQRARLQFERSRESLQRIQDLPPNSRARREAELSFAEADLNLRKSIDRNTTLKKTEKEATAAGVDGSEKVLDASEALANAKKKEAEAYRNVQDAVISAARAQRDANRQVEDAERALAKAKRDVADASKKASSGVDQFADSMKRLSPEAQEFVKFIISIKDEFQELRAAAGRELFPRLIIAIDNLIKNLLPRLIPLFQQTGKVLGEAATSFSETVTQGRNLERLEGIFKTNDTLLRNFSAAVNNLYEVFLILLTAAEPLILRFGEWVETLTNTWKETLNAEGATERLTKRFNRAGDVFAKISKIFKNFGKALGGLTKAINQPGGAIDILLDKLDALTLKFMRFATAPENAEGINTFFVGVVENAGKILVAFGEILRIFGVVGASDDFGGFMDQIILSVKQFGEAANKFSEQGGLTIFGEFIFELSRLINNFTESGSITVFFGILRNTLEIINNFLETKFGKRLITEIAPIIAVFSAVGYVVKIARFFIMVFIGNIGKLFKLLTFFFPKLATLGFFISAPFLIAAAAIAGVILLFVGLYNSSEEFRIAVKSLYDFFIENFLVALEEIKAAFGDATGDLSGLKDMFKQIGDFIARNIVPILKGVLATAFKVVTGLIIGLIFAVRAVLDAFRVVFNGVKGVFKLFLGDTEGAVEAFKKAWDGLKSFFLNLFKSIYEIVRGALNGIISLINEIIKGVNAKSRGLINIPTIDLARSATELFPSFADGGVISPSSGGSLIRVAEAGKAERVEPLDSSGLSKRDRALIQMLAVQSGAGSTINVYPSAGMDEKALAEMVSRKLAFQMRRGGI